MQNEVKCFLWIDHLLHQMNLCHWKMKQEHKLDLYSNIPVFFKNCGQIRVNLIFEFYLKVNNTLNLVQTYLIQKYPIFYSSKLLYSFWWFAFIIWNKRNFHQNQKKKHFVDQNNGLKSTWKFHWPFWAHSLDAAQM